MHSTIGFPGLGLEFNFSRTAFSIFGINVQWYGIILTAGILVAFFLFYRRATKTEGIKEDDVLNVTLFTVPIAIIGARLFFVLTSLDKYTNFWDVFKIWKGGIAIYGAIIFGAATVYIYCRVKKIKALRLLDAISPAVMMGQIIGRWGNFINAEAYGWSAGVEKLPWRMTVGNVYIDDVIHPEIQFVHPTFLYESLWNLIGFIIIQIFYKHKKKDGQILLMYVGWYGLGRGLIELLRTDSLRVFGVKIFVILGLGSFIVCAALFIRSIIKSKKDTSEILAYESAYNLEPYKTCDSENADQVCEKEYDDVSEDDVNEEDVSDQDISDLEALDGVKSKKSKTENKKDGNNT